MFSAVVLVPWESCLKGTSVARGNPREAFPDSPTILRPRKVCYKEFCSPHYFLIHLRLLRAFFIEASGTGCVHACPCTLFSTLQECC